MSKEKRRFKRYSAQSDFTIKVDGSLLSAVTCDYSVDGLSAFIEGEPALSSGDVVEISIPKLSIKTPAKVMRVTPAEGGMSLGLQRVGPLYGSVSDFAVSDILLGLQRSDKTGMLHIKSGGMQKSAHFLRGDIIFATSNLREDWLGEILLRENRITREQFIETSELMKTSGKRHGTVLVESGILKPMELFEAVTHTVEHVVISLFNIQKGEFLFKEGPLEGDETIKLKLSAANLIYRGLRQMADIALVRSIAPSGNQVICFSSDPLDLFQDLKLSEDDRKLFSMVDGQKTYKELVQGSGLDAFDAMRAFNALLGTRVVEVQENIFASPAGVRADTGVGAGEAKPEPKNVNWVEEVGRPAGTEGPNATVQAEDVFKAQEDKRPTMEQFISTVEQMHKELRTLGYYGVLEIAQDAAPTLIKRAYYNKAREFHPDKHYGLPDPMKDKLNAIFTYITNAYSTLTNSDSRAEYDRTGGKDPASEAMLDPLQRASRKFEEGMILYKKGRNEQAAQIFGEAAYLDSENPTYHYFGARALIASGKHREAERTLQRAIRIEPFNADYLAEAGHIYLALGFVKRARSSFEKAVKLTPMHERAMQGISELPSDE